MSPRPYVFVKEPSSEPQPFSERIRENSWVVQWLGLYVFTVEGLGSTLGWGPKILQTVQWSQKKKKEIYFKIKKGKGITWLSSG